MTQEVKQVQEELLRTFEEFKTEIKKDGDNVERISTGMLALQDEIKDIKTSIAETKVRDAVGAAKEKSDHEKKFTKWFKSGGEADGIALKTVQGVVGTPADGGYAVPTVLDTNLTALLLETSDMRGICKNVTIGGQTGYIHTISQSNAATAWGDETAPSGATNSPTLGQVTINTYTLNAAPEVSSQMIEDVFFDAEAWYVAELAKQFAVAEGTAFVNGAGSGSNQPKGLLTYTANALASNAADYTKLNTIAAGTAGTIAFTDVYALPYAVKPGYRKNGRYVMNRGILQLVMQLKSTTGQPLWQPSMIAGQPATLNGYEVSEFADYPSVISGSATTLGMTFGDFGSGYTVVDRMGTTVQRNPFVNFPFIRFQTRKRVGGGLEDGTALVTLAIAHA